MANRTMGGGQVNGGSAIGSALSGATTGVKLTYTCPAGMQAEVTFVSVRLLVGTPVMSVQAIIGGVTITVLVLSVNTQFNTSIMLGAGDTVVLNVITLSAGSTFDGLISAREFLAA